jgi:hypothetical protein
MTTVHGHLDRRGGRVQLRMDAGDLALSFPPTALQGVQLGDMLTVELAVKSGR